MGIELKPCPFCGGKSYFGEVRYTERAAEESGWGQTTFHFVNCLHSCCDNKGLVGHLTQEAAANHWNKRTGDPK